MKLRLVLAATAALALAACGKSETAGDAAATASAEPAASAAAEASPAATPAAAPAAPGAALAAGAKPTKEFMVGKWGDNGDCALAIDFKADGTMVGPFEKWDLEDGKLSMDGNPQKMHLTVIDQDTLESRIDGTGSPHKLNRCK